MKNYFHSLPDRFLFVWKRFPLLVLLAIIVVTIGSAIYHNYISESNAPVIFVPILMIPFIAGADLLAEVNKWPFYRRLMSWIFVLFFALGFYFKYLANDFFSGPQLNAYIVGFLIVTGFLFFIISPFLLNWKAKNAASGFSRFCLELIVRLAMTLAFFGVFYLGIVLFIFSLNYLFEIDLIEYLFDIWLILAGLPAFWFFLGGIPADLSKLNSEESLLVSMRSFATFLFVPLIFLYFILLYSYGVMILATGEWPKDGVADWILGFSVVGFVGYFLISLPQKTEASPISEWYQRSFFPVLIPLLALLFWAFYIRVNNYGFTEKRYLLMMMGIWMFFCAIYFIWPKKNQDFRIPLLGLIFLLLISAFGGPVNAFEISRESQLMRLENILMNIETIDEESVKKIRDEKRMDLDSIIRYLQIVHGRDFVDEHLTSKGLMGADKLMELIWQTGYSPSLVNYVFRNELFCDFDCAQYSAGFNYFFGGSVFAANDYRKFKVEDQEFELYYYDDDSLILSLDGKEIQKIDLKKRLADLIGSSAGFDKSEVYDGFVYKVPNEVFLTIPFVHDNVQGEIRIMEFIGNKLVNGEFNIEFINVDILLN